MNSLEDSPIDRLLAEQGTLLTPVNRFSDAYAKPRQARFYKELIPLTRPAPGEQYGFQVDLDRCTGCKACVSACHSLNGLEDDETWRDVGLIHGLAEDRPYQQTVTTACHHCIDPGCLSGCPVLAYEKDPETGIVRHLDDQCIGCQYCVLKCPYDVPKYSKKLGIVRKCDMCHGRLATGEAPACVQACPTEAISITIVNRETAVQTARAVIRRRPDATVASGLRPMSSVADNFGMHQTARRPDGFLPGAPDPRYTIPTTLYVTKKPIPASARAADERKLKPEHAHLPLVFMLVLTQLSAGIYTISAASGFFFGFDFRHHVAHGAGLIFLHLGLAASIAHLGKPLGAWRAFLGLRTSWLSREIVVFGGFAGVASMLTLVPLVLDRPHFEIQLLAATVIAGLLGVFCSVMIYHDTRRDFWRFPVGAVRFFGTTALLGTSGYAVVEAFAGGSLQAASGWAFLAVAVLLGKVLIELAQLPAARRTAFSTRKKSALLLFGLLRRLTVTRLTASLFGAGLLLAGALHGPAEIAPRVFALGFLLLLGGELMERTLFFKAVVAPKMPGGF